MINYSDVWFSFSEKNLFSVFGLSDDVGREAHLLCQGRENILQERLHQVQLKIQKDKES